MSAQDDKNRAEAQKRDAQNEINQHNSEKAKAEKNIAKSRIWITGDEKYSGIFQSSNDGMVVIIVDRNDKDQKAATKGREWTKKSGSKIDRCLIFTKKKSQYLEGNRNNFIYLFASNCNREGILENEALSFAKREFDLEENEIRKTIQSAYHHHTNEHGGNQTKRQSKRYQQLDAQESFYSNLTQTPCFPNHVYEQLPDLLKHCCKVFDSNREKDVFLTGALAVLSGSLSDVQGIYDGRTEYSNIFTFVIAPPANGKGTLKYAAMLGDAFHQKLSQERQEALTNYQVEMTSYRSAVRDFTKGKEMNILKSQECLN